MRLWEDERDILERGRQIGIEAFILDNIEENIPKERIIEKLTRRFEMSINEAEFYYNKYSI